MVGREQFYVLVSNKAVNAIVGYMCLWPISNPCSLSKIFEKLILKRILIIQELFVMPAIYSQSLQLTISKYQQNYRDKIPRLIKNFIRTNTLQLFTKHRVAGQLLNIPLMYNLVLWNNFLEKKMFMFLSYLITILVKKRVTKLLLHKWT